MNGRPELNKDLDSQTFKNYYYLKEELAKFCKQEGLQTSGGKADLNERIIYYLDTGEKLSAETKSKISVKVLEITEDTLIEENFICSEKHREFFREKVGRKFSFNVKFQNWLKSNPGKKYSEAIEAYYQVKNEMKNEKTKISGQFEYNTYIRDFFAGNKGKSLNDAICCWKYKKGLPGHNKYEEADLAALEL